MKTRFLGLAALLVTAAAASAQTVVVPAAEPVPPSVTVVPAPVTESTTVKKRVTVIPAPLAVPSSAGLAPVTTKASTTTTTTATTTGVITSNGVVDVYEPGTRFVVRESTGPVSYTYSPQTVYSTPGGVVLTGEQVTTRMRAGLPVRVEYMNQGDARVIQRVVIED